MRIRTIKPEWLDDERLASCSDSARFLSAALITQADDAGRGKAGIVAAARYFPTNPARFEEAFAELVGWYVRAYIVRGQSYYQVLNFEKHQVIDKRRFRVLTPDPEECGADALHMRCTCDAPAPRDRDQDRDQDQEPDQERKVTLKRDSSRKVRSDVQELFDYWRTKTGQPRAKLDGKLGKKRRRQLRDALDSYDLDRCKRVVDGAMLSDFHKGKNDRGTSYLSIDLLFRDAKHIEEFESFAHKPPESPTKHEDMTPYERRLRREALAEKVKKDSGWLDEPGSKGG